MANHKPIRVVFGKDEIITLQPGQFITSRPSLSKKTGIERNRLERLLTTMEEEEQIEQRKTSVSRLITILKWNEYQDCEQRVSNDSSNKRATSEQRMNSQNFVSNKAPSSTYEENLERVEQRKNNVDSKSEQRSEHKQEEKKEVQEYKKRGSSAFEKPSVDALKKKCSEIGLPEMEAEWFFHYYESNGWRVGKNPMKSWESALQNWKKNFIKRGPDLFNSHEKHHANNRPCADRNKGTFNEGKASQYDELSSP